MINQLDGITVLMPTYNQGHFIARAISSLILQELTNWELIIINDGSTDYTEAIIENYSFDNRIRVVNNDVNQGLGSCLNAGLSLAKFNLISYLPSDDIIFKDHLQSLYSKIKESDALLVYSGIRYHYTDLSVSSGPLFSIGQIPGFSLQLVQVIHKLTDDKWLERSELVTDDLNNMFWSKLASKGSFVETGEITCEWIDHLEQHHKFASESYGGGIFLYKQFYNIQNPIRFQSSVGDLIDEIEEHKHLQNLKIKESPNSLKILIVGELAYNADRICALEELGHQLFGLWINNPAYYTTTGPLPFGNVKDVKLEHLTEWLESNKPDLIYALLNHQAVPLANYVLKADLGIPIVWHFKEGPFVCRQSGFWRELIELFTNSDGRIFINEQTQTWFGQFVPNDSESTLILDGDLPKANWFHGKKTGLLSDQDGEIHTLIPGRPYGFTKEYIEELGRNRIHLHFYGNLQQAYWTEFIGLNEQYAPGLLHLHDHCLPKDWTSEFSKYDAGWLHLFESFNNNEYMRATWPDLNYPARISTLAAAGLPIILKNNKGNIVASQSLVEDLNIGIAFNTIDELADTLRNKRLMVNLRENVEFHKLKFSFDYHADSLVKFFRKVIEKHQNKARLEVSLFSV